jgi:CRP/FNR family transcriptional regulator, polysaccharide utilization system transcription regulator
MNQEPNKMPSDCSFCLFKMVVRQYLSEDDFTQLYQNTLQLRFKKGEHILKQGNIFTHIIFLKSGRVKFNFEDETGRNLVLTVVNSPNLLGGANMFNEDLNLFSITAIEDCEVCLIDINVLKRLVMQNAGLAIKLLEFVTTMFKDSILNFVSLAHKHVNGRIADILIYLSGKIYKSDCFTITLSRKELAEYAGCSQENIIHTLSRFDKEGIISLKAKKIEILDWHKLNEISRKG